MSRDVRLRIIGDEKDLLRAFRASSKGAKQFERDIGSSGITSALGKQADGIQNITAAEERLVRVRSKRASSIGLFRLAGVGLAAGAGLVAATQAVRSLGDALETTGEEAFTTGGRFKNMVSALTSGNLVGAFQALERTPQTLEDLGITAVYTTTQMSALQKVADGMTAALENQGEEAAKGARLFGLQNDELDRATGIYAAAGTQSEKLAQQLLDLRNAQLTASAATESLNDWVSRLGENFVTQTGAVTTFKGAVDDLPGLHGPGARATELPATPIEQAPSRGITRTQRNLWFDAMIGRQQDRVQDVKALQGQIAALGRIAALIRERLAITKDITRRLKLEDELLDITRQQAGLREQIAANTLEGKRLAAERERERIARERERVAKALATVKARQFRALGLAADGSQVVPGVANLRKQVTNMERAIEGTFLNTDKTKSLLARIRNVLGGGLGDVSRDVRSKVAEMLDGIKQQLKDFDGYRRTIARQAFDPNKLLAGLNLDPAMLKAIRGRLARVGPGGTVAPRGTGAFGMTQQGGAFEIQNFISIDGGPFEPGVTRRQNVRKRRNPPQKRGPTVAY